MYDTFIEGVKEAGSQGRLGRFILRELCDTPKVLVHAYWEGWMTKLQTGIQIFQNVASISDLPPAPPDGRDSWRQAFWELSPFITTALFLILVTYLPYLKALAKTDTRTRIAGILAMVALFGLLWSNQLGVGYLILAGALILAIGWALGRRYGWLAIALSLLSLGVFFLFTGRQFWLTKDKRSRR